jgi:spore germination protein GerM
MRAGAVLSTIVIAVVSTSCGVSGDDQLQTLDQEALLGLDETTTTSTSTTTIPSSVPTEESTAMSTTTIAIAAESVVLYFVDGNRLQPVTIELAGTATPSRVIQALMTTRPSGAMGIGLRTLLPPGLINELDAPGTGEVTVDLAAEPFNRIDSTDQRAAIGQIVMTLVNRPGIGQVRFTLDGAPIRVPRRDGVSSDLGDLVYFNDYASLLDEVEVEETTTTTTAAPPVTTPPPSTAAPAGP